MYHVETLLLLVLVMLRSRMYLNMSKAVSPSHQCALLLMEQDSRPCQEQRLYKEGGSSPLVLWASLIGVALWPYGPPCVNQPE